MRIAAAVPLGHALPLARGWPGAAVAETSRRGWLLRLDTDDGRSGFGECAPLPSHGSETHEKGEQALHDWCAALAGLEVDAAQVALDAPASFAAPAARSAVECALLDLAAQAASVPLYRLLAPAATAEVAVNALAGDAVSTTPAQIDALLAAGFTVIKLKLGRDDAARELAALQALATRLPAGVQLRLDANRSWDAATAGRMLSALAQLPVESVEEPLAVTDPGLLRDLQRGLPYALAIDESWRELDQEEFFSAPPVRRLVLKLAGQGGLLPALRTAQRAKAAGVDCVVTTGIDSACGTLAAAHLTAAVGNGLAHGLATSSWLTADTGAAPGIAGGRLRLPGTPGLGFVPSATRPASALPSTG